MFGVQTLLWIQGQVPLFNKISMRADGIRATSGGFRPPFGPGHWEVNGQRATETQANVCENLFEEEGDQEFDLLNGDHCVWIIQGSQQLEPCATSNKRVPGYCNGLLILL